MVLEMKIKNLKRKTDRQLDDRHISDNAELSALRYDVLTGYLSHFIAGV